MHYLREFVLGEAKEKYVTKQPEWNAASRKRTSKFKPGDKVYLKPHLASYDKVKDKPVNVLGYSTEQYGLYIVKLPDKTTIGVADKDLRKSPHR
jgi:hypothetical protein